MDYLLILKIALVGIIVSIVNSILKQTGRDELAFLASLSGLVIIVLMLVPYITDLFVSIQELFRLFD
jgi:stage III sporulation protein AC